MPETVSPDLKGITILDGGFSTQLVEHVGPTVDGDPLWSARFNYTNPEAVVESHLDFLRAGADIIITNTYQCSVEGYVEHLGLTPEKARSLISDTVRLAHKARDTYMTENPHSNRKPWIFGSVGPYGAHLHDGSEYTGDYADRVSRKEIADWHRPRIQAMVEAKVDALAIETIPCQIEGEVLIDLIESEFPGLKAWLSFQCKVNPEKDEANLASGEPFCDAALACWERSNKSLLAVGINCLHPRFVDSLCKSVNQNRAEKLPLVVYPNSGEIYTPQTGWTNRDQCVPVEKYVASWLEQGATFIGGCCRTNATDVLNIRKEVIKWLKTRQNGRA